MRVVSTGHVCLFGGVHRVLPGILFEYRKCTLVYRLWHWELFSIRCYQLHPVRGGDVHCKYRVVHVPIVSKWHDF